MSELSVKTLMIAIKAVKALADELAEAAKDENNPDADAIQMELFDVSNAAAELKGLYQPLQQASDNLPLYSRLVSSN